MWVCGYMEMWSRSESVRWEWECSNVEVKV
jgi:hypothetical protein